MQNIILTSLPFEQLQNAIKEAVRAELLNFTPSTREENPEFITRKETAQILGVSLVTLNEWTKTGVLQGYRIGSRVRYNRTEVQTSLQKVQSLKFRRA